eukprot:11214925-Lingulodinium_polyedra.AAC.1
MVQSVADHHNSWAAVVREDPQWLHGLQVPALQHSPAPVGAMQRWQRLIVECSGWNRIVGRDVSVSV